MPRRRVIRKKEVNTNLLPPEKQLEKIPKIIHQIWIGNEKRPEKLMETWKNKHPDYEYKFWNEESLKQFDFECQNRINEMETFCGKCDIIRLELLHKYGGIYIDADSFCIEKIDDYLLNYEAFFGYENEKCRGSLISNGNLGFIKNHPLLRNMIDFIKNHEISRRKTGKAAWKTTGPVLLTYFYRQYVNDKNIKLLPSNFFLPIHVTGETYLGHGKVYAHQEWGSTHDKYKFLDNPSIPNSLIEPAEYYSVIIPSFNTNKEYITDCLNSIKDQVGNFGIELIWINDGSDEDNTSNLENMLNHFIKTTRFIKLIYKRLEKNMGISYALNLGIKESTNEIIFRMDSDDIMYKNRMIVQIECMKKHSDIVWLGGQILINGKRTNHKSITLEKFKKNNVHWLSNHPAVCFRKKQILDLGGYNEKNIGHCEDFELQLKILKKYGIIHNIPHVLLKYRTHPDQITSKNIPDKDRILNQLIKDIIYE